MQTSSYNPMQKPIPTFRRIMQPTQHIVQRFQQKSQPKLINSNSKSVVLFPFFKYGPFVIRIPIGIMFIMTGIIKITTPEGIITVLNGLGFPIASFFGWVLIFSEILFGLMVVTGFKIKYAVWPLVVIMAVTIFRVYLPQFNFSNPSSVIMFMFHIITVAVLVSLFFTGPGKYSLKL